MPQQKFTPTTVANGNGPKRTNGKCRCCKGKVWHTPDCKIATGKN